MVNKKELASQQMRDKIFTTTVEIIGLEGYGAVTATNLSKKAHISKGALYHHFANLEEIRYETLAFLIDQYLDSGSASDFTSLNEFLLFVGESAFKGMDESPVATKALYNYSIQAFVDEGLKQQLLRLWNHALKQYEEVISHFCPGISEEELTGAIQILDACIGGAILQGYIMGDPVKRKANWELFSTMMAQYLSKYQKK